MESNIDMYKRLADLELCSRCLYQFLSGKYENILMVWDNSIISYDDIAKLVFF